MTVDAIVVVVVVVVGDAVVTVTVAVAVEVVLVTAFNVKSPEVDSSRLFSFPSRENRTLFETDVGSGFDTVFSIGFGVDEFTFAILKFW